jgi:hypothetical protein
MAETTNLPFLVVHVGVDLKTSDDGHVVPHFVQFIFSDFNLRGELFVLQVVDADNFGLKVKAFCCEIDLQASQID